MSEAPRTTNDASRAQVLVIDDSEIVRLQMIGMLEEAGFHAIGLASPIGATRTILRKSIKAVVIDVFMPSMRGDSLAAMFRANPRLRNVRVVLVSGQEASQLEALASEAKADGFVCKARLKELPSTLRRVMRQAAV